MKNVYTLVDNDCIIEAYSKGKLYHIYVDKEDLPIVDSYPGSWYVLINERNKYAVTRHGNFTVQMHRIITQAPKGMVVDHLDHNGLNNRKSNLEVVTNQVNLQRRRGAQINSGTGVRGVTMKHNKWYVQIRCKGKPTYRKSHNTFEEAVADATRMRKIMYGEE